MGFHGQCSSSSPRGLQHTMPYIVKSAWHPVVHLVGTRETLTWTNQLRDNTGFVLANLWRQVILQGHGGSMQQPEQAMR